MQEKLNKTIVFLIRFSIVMLIAGLAIGFISQFTSKVIFKSIPMEAQVFAERNMSTLHGHIIIIGFIVPMILAFTTNFVKNNIAINKGRVKRLRIAFKCYIAGSVLTLFLSTYKGLFYLVKLSQDISIPLDDIDEALFFGNHIFRSIIYSIAHPLFAFALLWYFLILWKGLGVIKTRAGAPRPLSKRSRG
ncbi:MAG TPA: hypothetical protein PK385_00560 [Spirochaetota bacterium]|nr:hypothetical protein [Spirochaetota bacterium]HOS31766.1 hypothetical protein [Spirochaetota bacterium]HOS54528.1 hypothetical protein [Spirochaetota bacterium]HPK60830.1 hypothetical protein [Spirochaetota bacterium]HQF77170.1 hypothetical protein [Spirochaetota bacterium]